MAFVATDSTKQAAAYSNGPKKVQIMTWTCASGDTSGTVTADKLSRADEIIIDGLPAKSAAPTFSGNVVTLAFADPVATIYGTLMVIGV